MTAQLWNRWHKESLANISLRQQWPVHKRNVKVGEVLIVKEDRNEWKQARVLETSEDDDVLERFRTTFKIKVGQKDLNAFPNHLQRPIQKSVVLVENAF